ncbi:hypothetical protein KPL74_09075 [Bacillus sp. NP157]|nr:hypothetical protein KPL74_09075 [Bacillus sp. NP157]
MSDNTIEIARDIVVAMVSNPNSSLCNGIPEAVAKNIATVFNTIYDAVNAKSLDAWKDV